MKVVIFCGGMGVRMGEATQRIPKPMITSARSRSSGTSCAGTRLGDTTSSSSVSDTAPRSSKQYFLDYSEAVANDFVLSSNGVTASRRHGGLADHVPRHRRTASIGDRLRAARAYLGDDEYFLATYGDGLTDAPLDDMIDRSPRQREEGLFMSVRPAPELPRGRRGRRRCRARDQPMAEADVRINGGFFVFSSEIFDDCVRARTSWTAPLRLAARRD